MQVFDFKKGIPGGFFWMNEPQGYSFDNGLIIQTRPYTDFWQRTHYGFQRDDGHCLLTKIGKDFSFTARFEFTPKEMYDQCGIMVRIDEDNWIKASIEYENEEISRLGSVVTNLGYSDWATTDISSDINSMWYKVSRRGMDFLLESSPDGEKWSQMRVAHLHVNTEFVYVGIYACSPKDSSFECRVGRMVLTENMWQYEG